MLLQKYGNGCVLKCNIIFLALPAKEFMNKLPKVPVWIVINNELTRVPVGVVITKNKRPKVSFGVVITKQVTKSVIWDCNYFVCIKINNIFVNVHPVGVNDSVTRSFNCNVK